MKKLNKKKVLFYIGIFVMLFCIQFFARKAAGNNPIFGSLLLPTTSYTWKDMIKEIPSISIISLLGTLLTWYLKERKKMDI
jgi:uncharacterized membrane protein YczE